jgi:hypothetical protein
MRRSSLAVASAIVRLPRSIARRKMLSEWPCEVDAAPLRGRTAGRAYDRAAVRCNPRHPVALRVELPAAEEQASAACNFEKEEKE